MASPVGEGIAAASPAAIARAGILYLTGESISSRRRVLQQPRSIAAMTSHHRRPGTRNSERLSEEPRFPCRGTLPGGREHAMRSASVLLLQLFHVVKRRVAALPARGKLHDRFVLRRVAAEVRPVRT
jgi:hypothetical protein